MLSLLIGAFNQKSNAQPHSQWAQCQSNKSVTVEDCRNLAYEVYMKRVVSGVEQVLPSGLRVTLYYPNLWAKQIINSATLIDGKPVGDLWSVFEDINKLSISPASDVGATKNFSITNGRPGFKNNYIGGANVMFLLYNGEAILKIEGDKCFNPQEPIFASKPAPRNTPATPPATPPAQAKPNCPCPEGTTLRKIKHYHAVCPLCNGVEIAQNSNTTVSSSNGYNNDNSQMYWLCNNNRNVGSRSSTKTTKVSINTYPCGHALLLDWEEEECVPIECFVKEPTPAQVEVKERYCDAHPLICQLVLMGAQKILTTTVDITVMEDDGNYGNNNNYYQNTNHQSTYDDFDPSLGKKTDPDFDPSQGKKTDPDFDPSLGRKNGRQR